MSSERRTAPQAPADHAFWAAVTGRRPDGEAALFATLEAALADGRPPDMAEAEAERLEALAGERGYAVMAAAIAQHAAQPPTTDAAYFDALARSETRLLAAARDAAAEEAVRFLMACLRDAFDLGRGRRLAGGERALAADGPTSVN
ncbi:MAG: hypothetical protein RIB45_05590 [Marivibrio sp.]|uniref:hypothetical protein n=1 Tax=Marivibrio sp. TaxID=2039719 RepID=UPI0032EAA8AA